MFFSLLGVAQENCTTRSSYVQYSTPQQATGFSMGAYYAGNFLGKEKLWIEKKKNQPGDPGAVGRKCGQVKANWLG